MSNRGWSCSPLIPKCYLFTARMVILPQNPPPKLNRNAKWNNRMGKLSPDSVIVRQGPEKAEHCRVPWSWLLGCWITRVWVTEQTAGIRALSPCSTLTSTGGSSLLSQSKYKLQSLALSAHSLAQRKHLPISRQKCSEFPNPNAGGTFHSIIFQLASFQGEMLHQNKSSQLILADWNETWHRPRRRMP